MAPETDAWIRVDIGEVERSGWMEKYIFGRNADQSWI